MVPYGASVYWMAPLPVRRYLAAALLVAAALAWDLRPVPTVDHPFAAVPLAAGTEVTDQMVRWERVPVGMLPSVDLDGRVRAPVAVGEPLLPTHLDAAPPIPDGWWSVPLDLPSSVVAGSGVRVAITSPGSEDASLIQGIVVRAGDASGRGGAVAVPEQDAGRVATASAGGRALVLGGS